MDRILRRLIIASALAACGANAQENQPSPALTPTPAPKVALSPKPPDPPKKNDQFEDARRIFEKLLPDERRRFGENFQRWNQMPPDEKSALRDREQFRRERIAQEIDNSIQKSGLPLDADRREVYALRYAQERRKIEEQLRKEMDAKRTVKLAEMLNRLKVEFSVAPPAVSPSPSAAVSPK